MITINPNIYKYYAIIATIILATLAYVTIDFYSLNTDLVLHAKDINNKVSELEDKVRSQVTTRAPEETKPCQDWIGTNVPLPEGEVCFYDGVKQVQTHSDIQVWSYSEKQWVEPIGTGDPDVATILQPNDTELGLYYPMIVKCPWGCTLGYTE